MNPPTAADIMEGMLLIDDACAAGPLGNRASAYVTDAQGRRNIGLAAQVLGCQLDTPGPEGGAKLVWKNP